MTSKTTRKSNGNGNGNGTRKATADITTAAGRRANSEARQAAKVAKLENDGLAKGKGKGGTVTQHGGTTTGYQRGCRCDKCKAAMAEYTQARKNKKAAKGTKAASTKAASKNARSRRTRKQTKVAA